MGDARVQLERAAGKKYRLLAVDAFSSDAIPAHLLTKEAVQLYIDRLEPDGYRAAFRGGEQIYERYWTVPETYGGKYLWTDDYYNLLNILRAFLPRGGG